MDTPDRKNKFGMLDGLRGIAAVAVMVAHASSMILGHPLFERKYMAVQFFFMLSGFVVMCAYEARMKAGMTFGQFCLRRAIRLYPLIVFGAMMSWFYFDTFDAKFAAAPDAIPAVVFAILGMPFHETGFSFSKFPINPPEWSLFFELLAYAAFALLVRWASTWRLCVAATAGVLLYTVTDMHYGPAALPFRYNSFGIWASFTIGMLLWRAYQAKLMSRWSAPFPLLAIVMLTVCAIPDRTPPGVNTLLVVLVFPSVIAFGANGAAPKLRRLLDFLGELSYPLYILHWPIVLCVQHFLTGRMSPAATVVMSCVFSVTGAWAIYLVFDKPLRQHLNARFCVPRKMPTAHGAQPS